MACPYFVPTMRGGDTGWIHPQRLPLGGGWLGLCRTPGHEDAAPGEEELKSYCNLGYAKSCPRLPHDRPADAVRFAPSRAHNGLIDITYVCERNYLPGENGTLQYDPAVRRWTQPHANAGIQGLAEAYLQCYLETHRRNF